MKILQYPALRQTNAAAGFAAAIRPQTAARRAKGIAGRKIYFRSGGASGALATASGRTRR